MCFRVLEGAVSAAALDSKLFCSKSSCLRVYCLVSCSLGIERHASFYHDTSLIILSEGRWTFWITSNHHGRKKAQDVLSVITQFLSAFGGLPKWQLLRVFKWTGIKVPRFEIKQCKRICSTVTLKMSSQHRCKLTVTEEQQSLETEESDPEKWDGLETVVHAPLLVLAVVCWAWLASLITKQGSCIALFLEAGKWGMFLTGLEEENAVFQPKSSNVHNFYFQMLLDQDPTLSLRFAILNWPVVELPSNWWRKPLCGPSGCDSWQQLRDDDSKIWDKAVIWCSTLAKFWLHCPLNSALPQKPLCPCGSTS